METKKILGLDIGTNSIGAALINIPKSFDNFGKEGEIEWLGSRILPTDAASLQKFESGGQVETKAANRRLLRGSRRLKQRYILRRTRLIQVFKILGWLDESFPENFKDEIKKDENFKFKMKDYLKFSDKTIEEATKLLGVENKKGELKIPEDWIIYYLRKKALTEKISLKELARIIYMFNQRRGFKSSRKDLKEEKIEEKKWVEILKIDSVEELKEDGIKRKDGKLTFIIKAGKYEWKVNKRRKPEWEGKEFQLLFTEKNGKLNDAPKVPEKDDWELLMTALDNQIGKEFPGKYFFDKLVEDKNYKIRQIAVRREKYKKELETIWNTQLELRKNENKEQEILNENKIEIIILTLYKHNEAKQKELKEKGLLHIISEDIIYYQRELKSQKNSIAGCRYEKVKFKTKEGEEKTTGVKVAPKSSPEFQEFRIWQDIHNIRITENEQIIDGKKKLDVELNIIDNSIKEKLFELFDKTAELTQKNIFDEINKVCGLKLNKDTHKINMFANREELKGNETKEYFRKAFKKINLDENKNKIPYDFKGEKLTATEICEKLISDKVLLQKLWHILYSISSSDKEKSEKGIKTALSNPKNNFNLPEAIIKHLSRLAEIKKQYASLSSKAINKLLPLMRCGTHWNDKEIEQKAKSFLEFKQTAKYKELGEKIKSDLTNLEALEDFQALPPWKAGYVIYGFHSEKESTQKYSSYNEIDVMKLIPNNSLRNPIVEQVIREAMFLVKDICKEYGQPDEIHIELGRELKKNAKEKEKIANRNAKKRDEKDRIKKMLYELMNDKEFEEYNEDEKKVISKFVTKPNPESPIDIEKFKIWKSTAGKLDEEVEKYFTSKDTKEKIPTSAEIKKYALWLSQKCKSPYTGKIIPISKLFTNEYEKEHIIPRSKLKYDAFDNLVISESGINKLKGNLLARAFIQQKGNDKPIMFEGKEYTILTEEKYLSHCKEIFEKTNYKKYKNLLCEEIPNDFISRQLNDTRYITRKLSELLYPVAKEKEGIIFTGGSITSELKNEWGLNKIWKEILLPRFQRLEKITGNTYIINDKDEYGNPIVHIQVKENKDFELKRIDHRHHALDALVIAATTREHIRYLNSLNAVDNDEELKNVKLKLVKGKIREFHLPWKDFTEKAKEKLNETIVSIKANNKVVTKPKNKYLKWKQKEDGTWEKVLFKQEPNKKWMAVRKSMFKEPQGAIYLKDIVTKRFLSTKEKMDIVRLQINRMKVQNTPAQKHTSYIYDQEIREAIKYIIKLSGGDLVAIENYFKKNKIKDINGEVINTVKVAVFNEYAAKRVSLDKSFTHDKINKIPYAENGKSIIGNLLHDHLTEYENYAEKEKELKKKKEDELTQEEKEFLKNPIPEPFAGEGLDRLTKKNKGKPINKVTIYERKDPDDKFKNTYYETDKGGNVFYVMYENENFERDESKSISVLKAIENKIQNKPVYGEDKENHKTIVLSPNDLVYLPTKEEIIKIKNKEENPINWNDKKQIFERIYKVVRSSKKECYFLKHNIAKMIVQYDAKIGYGEIGSQNYSESTINFPKYDKEGNDITETSTSIKDTCIKIKVNRLGNIVEINGKKS